MVITKFHQIIIFQAFNAQVIYHTYMYLYLYTCIFLFKGFSSVSSIGLAGSLTPPITDSFPIWLSQLGCNGNESNLVNCPSRGWSSHDCTHNQDAFVTCSNQPVSPLPLAIRLIGGVISSEGHVLVRYNGIWGGVCSNHWDEKDSLVVCRELGYGRAEGQEILNTSAPVPVWMNNVQCIGTESHLWTCPFSGWGFANNTNCTSVYVKCANRDYDLRLFGNLGSRGLVQVYYRGTWGFVCNSDWTENNSNVLCRQLGYGGVVSTFIGTQPGGIVLMDKLKCTGTENRLVDCSFSGWGLIQARCNGTNYVGVECGHGNRSASVRLVERTLYEGLVQVEYSGHWGYVCPHYWGDFEAQVSVLVCNMNSIA